MTLWSTKSRLINLQSVDQERRLIIADFILTEAEMDLVSIIWEKGQMISGQLVSICEESFNWKKSTTYTMLKRVQDKGILVNEDSVVTLYLARMNALKKREVYL